MIGDAFLMMGAAALGHMVALTVALGVRNHVRSARAAGAAGAARKP